MASGRITAPFAVWQINRRREIAIRTTKGGANVRVPLDSAMSPADLTFVDARPDGAGAVDILRELARRGELAAVAAAASPPQRAVLTGAAYELVWPVVFGRLTRRLELNRGHLGCAVSVQRLADDCLDRFHDDVEAVVADLLTRATKPITKLEAWITSRLNAATVNGYRRRRGQRGALQRPRIPRWLAAALCHDGWLLELATEILEWAGVAATAGTGVWPLDSWAQRRALATGDWLGSDQVAVSRDVETVLVAMRQKPSWYAIYVEAPLGRKQAPVASLPAGADGTGEPAALSLTDDHETEDAWLRELAAAAVVEIDSRLARGEEPAATVVAVLDAVFAAGATRPDLEHPPHTCLGYEERVPVLLADPAVRGRVVETVLGILREER